MRSRLQADLDVIEQRIRIGEVMDSQAPVLGDEIEHRFQDTIEWWRNWSSQIDYDGPNKKLVLTSAITLKGLTNAPTGAIAAAATTSLPECPGGERKRRIPRRFLEWKRERLIGIINRELNGDRTERRKCIVTPRV